MCHQLAFTSCRRIKKKENLFSNGKVFNTEKIMIEIQRVIALFIHLFQGQQFWDMFQSQGDIVLGVH